MRRAAAVVLTASVFFILGSGAALAKGQRLVDFAVDGQGRAVALLQFSREEGPLVVRFTSEGAIDSSFSGDGVLRPPLFGRGAHLVLDANDGIVVGGRLTRGPPGRSLMLRRYRADGVRDRAFGDGGKVRLPYGELGELLVQPGGTIVALPITVCPRDSCGYLYRSVRPVRLAPSGRQLSHGQGNGEQWHLLTAAVEPGGGFLVIGEIVDESYVDFQRFKPTGRFRENLFDGIGLPPEEEREWRKEFIPAPTDLAFLADGRFVETPSFGPELWVRRADGSAEPGFGTEGRTACGYDPVPREYFGGAGPPFSAVAVAPDQKLVATGGYGQCSLVRFQLDGAPDPSFSGDGFVDVLSTGMQGRLEVAVLPDGGILLAGWDPAAKALRVARYSVSGTLAPGFGSGGIATLPVTVPG